MFARKAFVLVAGCLCLSGLWAGSAAAVTTTAPECLNGGTVLYLSGVDQNPTDARVNPSVGTRLLPLRASDSRIPFGFNDTVDTTIGAGAPYTPAQLRSFHQVAGSSVTRIPLDWEITQPTQGLPPTDAQWLRLDRMYCNAIKGGLHPLIVVEKAPPWAYAGVGCINCVMRAPSSAHDGDLEDFVEMAAIRYPDASFEAWNEPNLSRYWGDAPSASRYVDVLKAIYTGVKNGNPGAVVVSGGLSNTPDSGTNAQGVRVKFDDFLTAMYPTPPSTSAKDYMDALGIHPYLAVPLSNSSNFFYRTFDGDTSGYMPVTGIRAIIAAKDPGRRIWATEFGAPLNSLAVPSLFTTEAAISADLVTTYNYLTANVGGNPTDVDVAIYHTPLDTGWCTPGVPFCNAPSLLPGFSWVKQQLTTLNRAVQGYVLPRTVYCTFAQNYGNATGLGSPCGALPVPMVPNP